MVFEALDSVDTTAGKPTKEELFEGIRGNLDDHESRILTLESELVTKPPIVFAVQGDYQTDLPITDAAGLIRVPISITLTNAILYVEDAGSAGTLTVDVQLYTSSWSTIFSTNPSVVYTAGDRAVSSNAVLSTTAVSAGDHLRMDISSGQTGNRRFKLYLTYEVS